MESGRKPLSSKAIKMVVGVIIGIAVVGAVVLLAPQKPTENRGLFGINRRSTASLPDGIGPVKLDMTKEEVVALVLQRELNEDVTESFKQSDSPYTEIRYDYVSGKLYRIEFELGDRWGAEILEDAIKRYGKPARSNEARFGGRPGLGVNHKFIWRQATREL